MKVLILGGGDVGSAIAHSLFRRGLRVLICDKAMSPHARRGMAFTDAIFDGCATLDGVEARCEADASGVEIRWKQGDAIPIVIFPDQEVFGTWRFDVIVDATMKRNREPEDLRNLATLGIGVGPGYQPGRNCHMAIETQWGDAMGRLLLDSPAAMRSGGPRALDGVTRERFAIAPCSGVWKTQAVLGQSVEAGDVVGELAEHSIRAPIAGKLRGLSRDGVDVMVGQRLVEVDPRFQPEIRGLGERPLAIARGVVEALESVAVAREQGN
jgi:xanthine dehydrogenase accessory factor